VALGVGLVDNADYRGSVNVIHTMDYPSSEISS
jgi:hypothetical protein